MAKPKRGETIELVVDDLAFGGEGVGRADGYVVFVRGGLPGDRLRVTLTESRARYDVVLDIERCLLQSERMNSLLDELRRQVRERALSVWDPQSERGLLRFVAVREGRRTDEAMVNVVAAAPDVETLVPVAERLRARVPTTTSVVLNVNDKKASVAVGSEEHLLLGRDHITESLGGVTFRVSAGSFFQT